MNLINWSLDKQYENLYAAVFARLEAYWHLDFNATLIKLNKNKKKKILKFFTTELNLTKQEMLEFKC